jgi:hypothetical protein
MAVTDPFQNFCHSKIYLSNLTVAAYAKQVQTSISVPNGKKSVIHGL